MLPLQAGRNQLWAESLDTYDSKLCLLDFRWWIKILQICADTMVDDDDDDNIQMENCQITGDDSGCRVQQRTQITVWNFLNCYAITFLWERYSDKEKLLGRTCQRPSVHAPKPMTTDALYVIFILMGMLISVFTAFRTTASKGELVQQCKPHPSIL